MTSSQRRAAVGVSFAASQKEDQGGLSIDFEHDNLDNSA